MTPLAVQVTGDGSVPDAEPIDAHAPWHRPAPLFYVDLAGEARPTTALDPRRERHAAAWVHLGPRLIYGSHHFHACLAPDAAHLSLQETDRDRVDFRLRHHQATAPPAEVPIPRLFYNGTAALAAIPQLVLDRAVRVDGPVCLASPTEPDNWGIWLLEGLPSLHEFVRRGQAQRLLCWHHLPWQRDLLRFMGVDPDRVLNQAPWQVYRCEEVALRQVSRANLVPTASDIALFQDIAGRCGPPAGPRRIFLSRRFLPGAPRRRLLNEDALAEALLAEGFAEVRPETMPFEDQVRLFRGAATVVALGGAALFNTVFCRPGTTVVSLEGGPYFTEDHASLLAGLGHRYGFLLSSRPAGQDEAQGDWTIDVPMALQFIRTLG